MKFQTFFIGYISALTSATTYGLIPLFVLPLNAAGVPLSVSLFFRFLIAGVGLVCFFLIQRESLKISLKEGVFLLLLGLLYALSADFLFLGYTLLSPGIASTILFIYPVLVAVILWVFFRQKMSASTTIALFLTFIGVVFLGVRDEGFSLNYRGVFVGFLSALSYACYMVVVNRMKWAISSLKITCYSMLFSAFYYLVKSVIRNETMIPDGSTMGFIVVFSLTTTLLSLSTLVFAIQHIGATTTAILGVFEPLVAVAISCMLFGERISTTLLIGGVFIICGVLLEILSRNKNENKI